MPAQAGFLKYMLRTSALPTYSDFHRGHLENDFDFGLRAGILGYFERVHLIIASVDGRSDFGRFEKVTQSYGSRWPRLDFSNT